MTARTSAIVGWASVPVMLWMAQIFAGLLAGPEMCATPAAMHGTGAVLVAVSVFAVYRAWLLTREANREVEGSVGLVARVGFKLGLLFTAGIALSWLMAGLGTCL